jgi:small-conductance mechanosensitive channel
LQELAGANPRVQPAPPPAARVGSVGVERMVSFEVGSPSELVAVEDEALRAILKRFGAEEIELPFRQRRVPAESLTVLPLRPKGQGAQLVPVHPARHG